MKNINWATVGVAVMIVVALNKLPQTKQLVNG